MKISKYIYFPLLFGVIYAGVYFIFGGIFGSVYLDILYGSLFGFIMLFYSDWRVKKVASKEDREEASKVRPKMKMALFTNFDQTFDICLDAINSIKRIKIKSHDRNQGMIKAKLGFGWHTSGDYITLRINKLTDVTTEVELLSEPFVPTVLITSGEGWRALKDIAELINQKNHQMNTAYILENKGIPTDVFADLSKDKEKKLVK